MILENLRQRPHNTTLMGVVTGALEFFGLRNDDPWAYGGCGHAFMINIHEQLCPSGPYCWNRAGFHELVRNIGIDMRDLGFFHPGSAEEDKRRVEQELREHLGRSSR